MYLVSPAPVILAPTICGYSQLPAHGPPLQRRLQVTRWPHRGSNNRVGQKKNRFFWEGKGKQCFYFGSRLSQNWHMFFLIQPTTKKWPLSTQACQTLDSHTFLKGWNISHLRLGPQPRRSRTIALFPLSTFYSLQPVSHTGLCIRYAHRSISPAPADGGNCDS